MLLGFAAHPAQAQNADASSADDRAVVCDRAAQAAEAQFGIPTGLLSAIGKIESSRWRPELQRSVTWPFAIDSSGYDIFPETAEQAVAQVRSLQVQGLQSIDVGCFQINLFYHPQAFASLEDGFDPAINASYAARFLLSLRERTGSWPAAVAAYHSGYAAFGEPYRDRVFAAWQGGASEETRNSVIPMATRVLVSAAFATNPLAVSGLARAYPMMTFAGVRVVVPSQAQAAFVPTVARPAFASAQAPSAIAVRIAISQRMPSTAVARLRLPLVVTPARRS